VREIAALGLAVYRSSRSEAAAGAEDRWILRTGLPENSTIFRLQAAIVPGHRVAAVADTFQAAVNLVRLGLGQAVLPCMIGDRVVGLERSDGRTLDAGARAWVACHSDMMQLPHIKACFDFLCAELTALKPLLEGSQPA